MKCRCGSKRCHLKRNDTRHGSLLAFTKLHCKCELCRVWAVYLQRKERA